MNKLPNHLSKSINESPIEVSLQTSQSIEITLGDICCNCGGTGELNAMTMANTFDSGVVRYKDIQVDCNSCDGTGRK